MSSFSCGDLLKGASEYHTPVLAQEVLDVFSGNSRVIIDATAGGGGHSELLLDAGHRVIGLDRDFNSLKETQVRLSRFGDRFTGVHSNFSKIDEVVSRLGITGVTGILADFGVSSHQLNEAERGFSFSRNGPLDMRMDVSQSLCAAEIIASYSFEDLKRIFSDYGEERYASKIASRLVQERDKKVFKDTKTLADFVVSIIGKREKIHPATRVFQAIRIEVNNELGEIEVLLKKSLKTLEADGRLVCISFHSLEDRLVKRFMHQHSQKFLDRPEWPEPRVNSEYVLRKMTKKPIMAGDVENKLNPRARTAKMRVADTLSTL